MPDTRTKMRRGCASKKSLWCDALRAEGYLQKGDVFVPIPRKKTVAYKRVVRRHKQLKKAAESSRK